MPLGIGLDLVEVDRVARLLERFGQRALSRLLTAEECTYCMHKAVPARHVAARLAAKEAAFKALAQGGDTGYIGWLEFEISRGMDGRPSVVFHGRARQTASRLKVSSSLVSLSHTDTHAAAVVILYR